MKRCKRFLAAIGFLLATAIVPQLHAADKPNSYDQPGATIPEQTGPPVSDFLTPDGRFDLEAAKSSGYEGALELQGFNSMLDPVTGQPIAGQPGVTSALSAMGVDRTVNARPSATPAPGLWCTGNFGTNLILVDLTTGLASVIGPSGISGTWAAAFTPNGTLWTITNGFSASLSHLARFDLSTGAATNVGSGLGTSDVILLEASSAGTLYAAGFNGKFYTVDTITGQLTFVGNLGFPNIMDMAFDGTGTLWAVGNGSRLYKVNPATGAGTLQTTITGTSGEVMGLAVDALDNFYVTPYVSAASLYSLNPATGVATLIGSGLGVSGPHGGDVFVSSSCALTISCPSDVIIECDESTLPANTGTASYTASAGCGSVSLTYSDAEVAGACPQEKTITRTWTATPTSGSAVSCDQIITVEDNTAPVISCPANVSVECPGSTAPASTGTATATDNCDLSPTITFSDLVLGGGCPQEYTINRTWTATDDCGNASGCLQVITVTDNTAPSFTSCPANASYQCASQVPAASTAGASASDACDPSVAISVSRSSNGGSGCAASPLVYTDTYTATDDCGNSSQCVQTHTVIDNTAPVITCPANVSVECPGSTAPSITGVATATDNCDPSPTITHSDLVLGGGCPQEYTINRTWTATDDCGNASGCLQVITVTDNTAPSFTNCPADFAVECEADIPPCNPSDAAATDACGSVTITCSDGPLVGGPCGGTVTRTYTADDGCGNQATCTQTITVDDNTPPVFTLCPAGFAVECLADVPPCDPNDATATDNCGVVTITCSDGPYVGDACSGTITRTYTATDPCGNVATCDQVITIDDNTDPVFTLCPAGFTVDCSDQVPPCNPTDATATDNCGVVTVTCSDGPLIGDDCSGTITRTYVATDPCGNIATCDQIITIEDNTAPTITCPADFAVECLADVPACDPADATASDNCVGVTVTCSDGPLIGGECGGTITRTYTATDDCGNQASCDQIITVDDNTAPVFTFCPADFAVECEADIPPCNPNDATATDNCSPVTITCADGPLVGGPCGGTVTRTYTATDDCGNSSECDQIITVEDQTPPTVTCMLDIDVQRFVDLPPCDVLDATVTDNCGPVTVVCERSSVGGVGCTDVSVPITYTYTATDACGNEAFCERVVTVLRPDCPFFVAAGDVSSPVDVAVGGRSTIPIRLDSAQSDVGSFELAFAYDDEVFSIAQVERGSALADWEYFTYRLETGVIRLIAMADLANGAMHPPSSAYRPVGVLANVTVNVTPNRSLAGQSVYWNACLDGCTDNTISSRTGDMTFVMAESDYENCEASLSGSVLPGVRLASAQMRIVEPAGSRGDINQNGLSYEVGDAILLVNYLINGVEVFSEDAALRALQVQAGDVNGDGVSLTVADLTYLIRVISGSVSPTIEAKLSPYAGSATVTTRMEGEHLTISSSSPAALGGGLFVFRYDGQSIGEPTLSTAAEGMRIRSRARHGELRVLIYPDADSPSSIAGGTQALFSVPVATTSEITLTDHQLSDVEGRTITSQAALIQRPTQYALGQNYPNPFNAGTVIPFDLPEAGDWSVTVYNVAGQSIRGYTGHSEAGRQQLSWDGRDERGQPVASGVYFYRISSGGFVATRKMTLMK